MRLFGTYGVGGGVGAGTGVGAGVGAGVGTGEGVAGEGEGTGRRGQAVKRSAPNAAAVRTETVRTVEPIFSRRRAR